MTEGDSITDTTADVYLRDGLAGLRMDTPPRGVNSVAKARHEKEA